MVFEGYLEGITPLQLTGWAFDNEHSDQALEVEFTCRDQPIGWARANVYRPDLRASSIGNGDHGFVFNCKSPILNTDLDFVAARILLADGSSVGLSRLDPVSRMEEYSRGRREVAFRGMSSDPTHRPVFILGSARSGTSAIAQGLLTATPYTGHEEGHFLDVLAPLLVSLQGFYDSKFDEFKPDRDTMIGKIAEPFMRDALYHSVIMAMREAFPNRRWLDKTPSTNMISLAPRFREIWPNARFIFMKRRAIENIGSRLRKFSYGFEENCREWAEAMTAWLAVRDELQGAAMELDQHFMATRQHDAARAVGGLLGLSEVDVTRLGRGLETARPQQTGEAIGKIFGLNEMGWSRDDLATFREVCSPLMDEFGYSDTVSYYQEGFSDRGCVSLGDGSVGEGVDETMKILGSVDRCDEVAIDGWVMVTSSPETRLGVEIVIDEAVVGRCIADRFRQDLKDGGLEDGTFAFSFPTPSFIPKSEISRIKVKLQDSDVFLKMPKAAASDAAPVGVRETISRFGGLWIDRFDWAERLAAKHRKGEISEALSEMIFRFVRDGYIVIEGAVDGETVDLVNAEIEKFWVDPPPGLLIETFEPEGKMQVVPPNIAYREGATKMLDLYAFSRTTRTATAAPKVVEFLAAIFEDQPKAFQGLTFWNGSQQAMHKDTAYVKIDSNPMHLAASWLALEDVSPGTGELEYYIGSHRAPDFLFGGYSKWMETHTADHDRFLQSLHDDAKAAGHVKGSFLAKKGDVLIWHADLAHGGSAIKPPRRSRKSLVTHFTPVGDEPFYRRAAKHEELDFGGCRFVSQFADIA